MAEDERAYQRQRRTYRTLYKPAKLLMEGLLNYSYTLGPKIEGPCLILSNHVTDFDPILVGLSFPEHMYYVAGENVMRMGFLSKLVTRYASVIQRVKGTTDAEAALQILRTLRKGRNVCMFAEGNRSFNGLSAEQAVTQALDLFSRTRTNGEFVNMVRKVQWGRTE